MLVASRSTPEIRAALRASRGSAIVLVVLLHVDGVLSWSPGYGRFVGVEQTLRYFAMPTFFFSVGLSVSGYFRQKRALPISKRATTYGYQFLLWSSISALIGVIIEVSFDREMDIGDLMKGLVQPRDHLWFLYVLVGQLVVLAAISKLPAWVQLLLISTALALPSVGDHALLAAFQINIGLLLFGAIFGPYFIAAIAFAPKVLFSISTLVCVLAASQVPHEVQPLPARLCYDLLSLCSTAALTSFWYIVSFWPRTWAEVLGRRAFFIYVIHALMLRVPNATLIAFPASEPWRLYAFPIAGTLACLLVSLALADLLTRVPWLVLKPAWFSRVDGVARAMFRKFGVSVRSFGRATRLS